MPPTNDIQYFMNRISAISVTLDTSDGFIVSKSGCWMPKLSGDDPGLQLEDYGFLLWARDFLAAVIYPASVDSIKVTQAFREHRSRAFANWLYIWPEPHTTDRCQHPDSVLAQYGKKIARQVTLFNFVALFLIFLAIWGSVLIFSGRVLVREIDLLHHDKSILDTKFLEIERDEYSRSLEEKNVGTKGVKQGAASVPCPAADASYSNSPRSHYCEQSDDLAVRMQELETTKTNWMVYSCPVVMFMRIPSNFVGLFTRTNQSVSLLDACSLKKNDNLLTPSLQNERYLLEMMVDGLLGSILPATYACLGALAALFRIIGQKVEQETLGPADVGNMRNSLILGVLTGTVIGLFSDVLSWGDKATAPLGTTSLALLAGFASSRVFVMLDSVAERVFGHADSDAGSSRGGKSVPKII